ncbi:uncharacterized protein AB675_4434 [Cyphellophora attinorum]|uniref:Uncharacterized protein n=1 Tax=Cyphellophora attinorum TaxID=1664694 RepID=A0A0N1H4T9_9EURO|nr:uncharacterized protein AB675_4434 [Phialophora attinorum]KPI36492.1 hypothetical protein AB675_4434 [Phialophora attinorum]
MSATITTEVAPPEIRIVEAILEEPATAHLARTGAALDPPGLPRSTAAAATREHNPSWWPTDHRRIPDYRSAGYHPEWDRLTSSTREAVMVTMMFRGCEILRVSLGLKDLSDGKTLADLVLFSFWKACRGGWDWTTIIGTIESPESGDCPSA